MCEHGGRIRNEIRLALETGIKRKHQCHVKGLGSWKDFEIERGGGGQGLAWKQLHRRQRLVDECRVSVVARSYCEMPPRLLPRLTKANL